MALLNTINLLSAAPIATLLPSGDHRTTLCHPLSPFNVIGKLRGSSVLQTNVLATWPPRLTAILLESGENATAQFCSPVGP
jgi:hypothetical protein